MPLRSEWSFFPSFCLACRTVRAEMPNSAAALSMSLLSTFAPPASMSKISFSACSAFVSVRSAPESSSSAVMSYSPIH